MGTFPSAALQSRAPEMPDPVDNYSKLMQLRNAQQEMQQRAQMAPLQMQAAQQGVQAGQIGLQEAQQGQKDQQTFRAAMQDPSMQGKTIGQISDALAQKGAISQSSWVAAKKADLDHQESLAKLDTSKLDNAVKSHTQMAQLYDNIQAMPDDQLAANWGAITQQYNQIPGSDKMPLNPNQPLTKQQLSQFGPMISMGQAYLDQEVVKRKAKSDADTADVNLGLKQGEAKFYQQNGGAPGVPVEAQQQAAWLKKNPGKDSADFLQWKAKQSPTAMMMGTVNLTPEGMDLAANNYRLTGQLPANMSRDPKATQNIINRAANLDQQSGGEGIATNKSVIAANRTSLNNLQKNFDQVSAFEGTANKNLDLFVNKMAAIPDLGTKFANTPMRLIDSHMIGSGPYQAMQAARQTAAAETAKVLSSANASGVLSDTQKKEAEDMLNGNLSLNSMKQVVATLKQDFANRHQSYQQQLSDIHGRIKGAGSTTPQSGASNPAADPLGIR